MAHSSITSNVEGAPETTTVCAELEDVEEKGRLTSSETVILGQAKYNKMPDGEISGIRVFPKEPGAVILAIPRSEDTLMILCSKLTAIAEVVSAGQSVAIATAYAAAASQEWRAVQKAINEMRPPERRLWDLFETSSIALPDMDWKIDIDPTPLSPRPLRTARRRAEALNRLYKTNEALPPHSVWFTKHHSIYLPLVKAMARVIGAERDLVGGGVWTATQLADLQSINEILSVTAQLVKGGKSKDQLRAISNAQAVLVSRRDSLRNLIISRKRKRGI